MVATDRYPQAIEKHFYIFVFSHTGKGRYPETNIDFATPRFSWHRHSWVWRIISTAC